MSNDKTKKDAPAEAPAAATTAVATQEAAPVARKQDIRSMLEGDAFKSQIEKALPKHLTPDRFIRVALTAMTRTPLLKECDSASFFKALLDLSSLGLEPDGRRAHLIPFRNKDRGCVEVQLIVDYKGLVELVMRSGTVSNIHADVVCENDEFEYNMGDISKHRIDFRRPRGEVYAVYSVVTMKDGTRKCEVMSRSEVESVRSRSKAGKSGPWVTDWNEMSKKTVFRRLSKWLPLSSEYRDAIEMDDDRLAELVREEIQKSPPVDLSKRLKATTAKTEATVEDAVVVPPADAPSGAPAVVPAGAPAASEDQIIDAKIIDVVDKAGLFTVITNHDVFTTKDAALAAKLADMKGFPVTLTVDANKVVKTLSQDALPL
jgi:recombination protein RecT